MTKLTEELRPTDRILITDAPDGRLPASEWADGPWFPALPGNPGPIVATINKVTIEAYGYQRLIMWTFETDQGTIAGYGPGVEFHEAPTVGEAA